MSDNIVSFEKYIDKSTESRYDELHDIGSYIADGILDNLWESHGVDIESIEGRPEIIFMVEAIKCVIMTAEGFDHPFQQAAQEFFDSVGIKVIQTENGYSYVFDEEIEDETVPANDSE